MNQALRKTWIWTMLLWALGALSHTGLAEECEQLVILNASSNSRMETAITMFHEKYPDTEVVLK